MSVSAHQIALGDLRRVVEQRGHLDREYERLMVEARAAGCTYAAIGRAAGVKAASAHEFIKRHDARRSG